MRQVKREREVVSFTKGFLKPAMLFPHSVATKEMNETKKYFTVF